MAETNIKNVKLKIGTESQFQDKLKDLPIGTLVGTTDPIDEGDLSTELLSKIDGKIDKKVSKFTDTSSYDRAYIQNSEGTDAGSNIDYEPSANSLARRNATGQLQVEDPLTDKDAVNKSFLENAVKTIVHISNTLLGE